MKSRRSFVRNSALAGASIPLFNIGTAGASPNEKINLAGFGVGGRAWGDIRSLLNTEKVNLVAAADVDEERLNKFKARFPEVRTYKDWRVLLEKEGSTLDAVSVGTPDHMHAPIGVTAMKMGLHVYGEKPLAHNLYETRRMAEIAKETGVVTQMGIQIASTTYERLAVKLIRQGVIGKVKEVHIFCKKTWGDSEPRPDRSDPVPATLDWDLWCGVGPKVPFLAEYYHPVAWRKRLDYGTGSLGDMGCHLYSPMFRALNLHAPISVKSTGGKPNEHNWAPDEKFEYIFPGNEFCAEKELKVTWYDGAHRPPREIQDLVGGEAPRSGCIFVGTEGVLNHPHMDSPRLFPQEKFAEFRYPKFPARDHFEDFVNAVRGEDVKPIADFHAYAGPLTEAVLLGALASHFPDVTLEWDAENLRFKNNDAANALIKREYREGWEVDGLT